MKMKSLTVALLVLSRVLIQAQPTLDGPVSGVFSKSAARALVQYTTNFNANVLTSDTTNNFYGSNLMTNNNTLMLVWNRPPTNGMIAYFPADDYVIGNSQPMADYSPLNNTATSSSDSTSESTSNYVTSAYVGTNFAYIQPNSFINAGSVLAYDRTQKMTAMAAIKVYAGPPVAGAELIIGNAGGATLRGWELWIDNSKAIHVRIMNAPDSLHAISVIGTTNVCDNVWHIVGFTYDGSSTAAGIHIYVDGVQDATTVEWNTLSLTTASPNPLIIGNQELLYATYYLRGALDEVFVYSTNKSGAFLSTYPNSGNPLPVDSDCVLAYHFEQPGGFTVTDSSVSGFNGAMSQPEMWGAGSNSIPGWMGLSSISELGNGWSAPDNAAYNVSNAYTFSGWFANTNGSTASIGYHYNGANGGVRLVSFTGTERAWQAGNWYDSKIAPGNYWHKYDSIYGSSNLNIYIDGVSVTNFSNVPYASAATGNALVMGGPQPGGTFSTGLVCMVSLANTNFPSTWPAQYATRFPSNGIASILFDTGGGSTFTSLTTAFATPASSALKYRIGVGASSGAAQSAASAASFVACSAVNSISGSGRYAEVDFQLLPSTDPQYTWTPYLTNCAVVYSQ